MCIRSILFFGFFERRVLDVAYATFPLVWLARRGMGGEGSHQVINDTGTLVRERTTTFTDAQGIATSRLVVLNQYLAKW
mgnify:FL=1